MKLKNSDSLTPSPVPPPIGEDVSGTLDLYDKYYATVDKLNESHYKHGKMVDREVTSNHVEILKTLIYMLIDDIKTETPVDSLQVEKICKCVVNCIDLLPETPKNVTLNKRIAAKLIGYSLELHKLHI